MFLFLSFHLLLSSLFLSPLFLTFLLCPLFLIFLLSTFSGSEYMNHTLDSRPLSGRGRNAATARLEPTYLPCLGRASLLQIPKGERPDSAIRRPPLGITGINGVSVPLGIGVRSGGRPVSPTGFSTDRKGLPLDTGGLGNPGVGYVGGVPGVISPGLPSLQGSDLFSGSVTPVPAPFHDVTPLSPPVTFIAK